jgi:hypothetical protein
VGPAPSAALRAGAQAVICEWLVILSRNSGTVKIIVIAASLFGLVIHALLWLNGYFD